MIPISCSLIISLLWLTESTALVFFNFNVKWKVEGYLVTPLANKILNRKPDEHKKYKIVAQRSISREKHSILGCFIWGTMRNCLDCVFM